MELTRAKRDSRSRARRMRALALCVVGLAVSSPSPAQAAGTGEKSATRAAARRVPRQVGGRSLEERVAMLSKALHLDARQQSELRKVLEDQREQVGRVWSDTSVPASYRVLSTQAIADRTADRIRALLNEEQRKRYNPPKRPHQATPGSAPSVEAWMNRG
jgi:hypothetical protein